MSIARRTAAGAPSATTPGSTNATPKVLVGNQALALVVLDDAALLAGKSFETDLIEAATSQHQRRRLLDRVGRDGRDDRIDVLSRC